MVRSRIGEALKAAREARGLTQQEAAAALGAPLRTYQQWEAGRGAPAVLDRLETMALWAGFPLGPVPE